jgi:hypothetical protein
MLSADIYAGGKHDFFACMKSKLMTGENCSFSVFYIQAAYSRILL